MAISELASNTSALFAAAVPLVIPSSFSKSASAISAEPIIKEPVAVTVPATSNAVRGLVVPMPTLPVPFGMRAMCSLVSVVISVATPSKVSVPVLESPLFSRKSSSTLIELLLIVMLSPPEYNADPANCTNVVAVVFTTIAPSLLHNQA